MCTLLILIGYGLVFVFSNGNLYRAKIAIFLKSQKQNVFFQYFLWKNRMRGYELDVGLWKLGKNTHVKGKKLPGEANFLTTQLGFN